MSILRDFFPYFKKNKAIYFDNAATHFKLGSVIEAEKNFLEQINANPHSRDFENAFIATEKIMECRKNIAKFINAKNDKEIIITSGTTYSLNQVAFGLMPLYQKKSNVVITELEHASNTMPWLVLKQKGIVELRYAPLNNDGTIDEKKLDDVIDENTILFSFASVTNTVGAANDVKKIITVAKKINQDLIVSVDIAQSIAHDKTDVIDWDADLVAFSAHKMFGPFSIGVLWGKMNLLEKMEPLVYGGGNNYKFDKISFELSEVPDKFEAGTPNISAIFAFNEVFKFLENDVKVSTISQLEIELKEYAVKKAQELKNKDVIFYNLNNEAPILLFNVKNIPAQDLGTYLSSKHNIMVRTGTHCAKNSCCFIGCESTVRASFSFLNTKEELDKLFIALEASSSEWLDFIL